MDSVGYVGEIRMFAGDFAPLGWAACDGSLLSLAQNRDLYNLIGITYGGDGVNTFQLPDMRGRIPVHAGTGDGLSARTLGEQIGAEKVELTEANLPNHLHDWMASSVAADSTTAQNAVLAATTGNVYNTEGSARLAPMSGNMVGNAGGQAPHNNMMPSLCIQFIICLAGVKPSAA